MKKNIYVDVNVIQTVPASNLNRDDAGAPKSCIYGGVPRARVSSQAWKRAVRKDFQQNLPVEEVGVRTEKIVKMVSDQIKKIDASLTDESAEKKAIQALTNAGFKIKSANEGINALVFMSQKQAEALARLIVEGETDKKVFKEAFKSNPSIDMAMFGRMVATDPSLNYDASTQVAHALSTHEVQTEYDYFTAVDDLNEDNAGAGHLGVMEFNSSTLYRYANVNCKELFRNLGQGTPEAVKAFVEAFITSMPTGKQNSYANTTLPSGVYIAVRTDQPVSLAPAFEKAIPASEEGFEGPSMKKMAEYVKTVEDYVNAPCASYVIGEGLEELGTPQNLKDVLSQLKATVGELLSEGGE